MEPQIGPRVAEVRLEMDEVLAEPRPGGAGGSATGRGKKAAPDGGRIRPLLGESVRARRRGAEPGGGFRAGRAVGRGQERGRGQPGASAELRRRAASSAGAGPGRPKIRRGEKKGPGAAPPLLSPPLGQVKRGRPELSIAPRACSDLLEVSRGEQGARSRGGASAGAERDRGGTRSCPGVRGRLPGCWKSRGETCG